MDSYNADGLYDPSTALNSHNSVGVLDVTVGILTRSDFIKRQNIEYSETSIKLTPSGPSQVSA